MIASPYAASFIVAEVGSTPPRAARCMASIQDCAPSGSAKHSDTDRRRRVAGSVHRARAR
jgi:hypothetical protein